MLPPLLQYYTVWTETLVPSPMGKIFGLKHRHHTIVFFGLKLFIAWTRHSLTTETLTVTVTLNTHTQFTVNSNLRYDLHTDIHWQFKPPLWPLHWTHTHIHWQFKPSLWPSHWTHTFTVNSTLRCDLHTKHTHNSLSIQTPAVTFTLITHIHCQFKLSLCMWPSHWTHTHIHWQFKPSPSVSFCDFERLRCDHASDRVGVGRGGYNTRQLVAVTMPVTGLGWVGVGITPGSWWLWPCQWQGWGGYNTRQLVAVTMPVTGLGWV